MIEETKEDWCRECGEQMAQTTFCDRCHTTVCVWCLEINHRHGLEEDDNPLPIPFTGDDWSGQ